MEDRYCVIVHECDEDGPFTRSRVFDDLNEAREYAEDVYGIVYRLEEV